MVPTLYAASRLHVDDLGANTYAVTCTATTGFDRDTGKFRREAEAEAARVCAEKGRTLKLITVNTDRPHFGGGYASAKVIFKALEANDPELTAPQSAAAPAAPGPALVPAGTLPTYQGDAYGELLKLDDLRKRGIITDREFEQQKKKLLKNWK